MRRGARQLKVCGCVLNRERAESPGAHRGAGRQQRVEGAVPYGAKRRGSVPIGEGIHKSSVMLTQWPAARRGARIREGVQRLGR